MTPSCYIANSERKRCLLNVFNVFSQKENCRVFLQRARITTCENAYYVIQKPAAVRLDYYVSCHFRIKLIRALLS